MIPETVHYYNNDGVSIELNEATNPRYPLLEFDMPVTYENDPVKKMQRPGEWPTFAYPRFRTFNLRGDILGNSVTDYNDAVGDLKQVVQPPYTYYDLRRHGSIRLKFYGDATTYYAYVILVTLDIPKEANYPSVGSYAIVWRSFEPYLRSTSSDAVSLRY